MMMHRVIKTALCVAAAGFPLMAFAGPAPDGDSDGTPDVLDICSANATAPNPCGFDGDNDGYGSACDGDFNNDGAVNAADVDNFVLDLQVGVDSGFGTDTNCDGAVNAADVDAFISQLQQGFPGPSGLPCAGNVPCM